MSPPDRVSAAIILDCRDHGESDKIVTFFTRDRGRLTGIAKGANRSKKRFVNKLELFSLVTITYSEGRRSSLAFISEADLHSSFINLRSNINLYNGASIIREMILMSTAEGEGDSEIYHLLVWALNSLDKEKPHLSIIAIFLLRLYDLIGYRPDLTGCRSCNTTTTSGEELSFHHMTGGLICSNCMDGGGGSSTKLSMGTIKLLESVLSQPLEKLHRMQFSRQALQQSLTMLHRYGRHLFQREIQSWKVIHKTLQHHQR
jgi:DNA repair protein RecO (recombination protein O)